LNRPSGQRKKRGGVKTGVFICETKRSKEVEGWGRGKLGESALLHC